jgi:hypothetical protein
MSEKAETVADQVNRWVQVFVKMNSTQIAKRITCCIVLLLTTVGCGPSVSDVRRDEGGRVALELAKSVVGSSVPMLAVTEGPRGLTGSKARYYIDIPARYSVADVDRAIVGFIRKNGYGVISDDPRRSIQISTQAAASSLNTREITSPDMAPFNDLFNGKLPATTAAGWAFRLTDNRRVIYEVVFVKTSTFSSSWKVNDTTVSGDLLIASVELIGPDSTPDFSAGATLTPASP